MNTCGAYSSYNGQKLQSRNTTSQYHSVGFSPRSKQLISGQATETLVLQGRRDKESCSLALARASSQAPLKLVGSFTSTITLWFTDDSFLRLIQTFRPKGIANNASSQALTCPTASAHSNKSRTFNKVKGPRLISVRNGPLLTKLRIGRGQSTGF